MSTVIGELRARMIAEATQLKSEIAEVKKGIIGMGEEGQKTSRSFDAMSSSLGEIAQNTRVLKSIDEQFKKLDPSKVEKGLEAIVAELQKIGQASKQAEKVGEELKDTGAAAKQAEASFDGLNAALATIGLNAQQIRKIGDGIRNANPQILEKQLQAVRNQLRSIGLDAKQIEKVEDEMKQARSETDRTQKSIGGLGSTIAGIGAGSAFVKLTTTIKSLADEAQQLSMAYSGLSAVSKSLNVDVEKSADLADELADRWGLSRTEMANTVKTYLTAGLTLDQTRNIMIATADAAVYNRQANLSWSEAIQQVAQGIKMGVSELTDAAGITTNLSVMYDRYAKSIGTSAAKLTDAQKIQAAYNGMLQEGAMFAGNADEAMTGYTGTQATFNQTLQNARIELGEDFIPVLQDLLETVTPIIREFASFADGNEKVVAGTAAATLAVTALIAVVGSLTAAFLLLNSAMGPIGWMALGIGALVTGTLAYKAAADAASESVWKFAQNQDELNKKLSESPLNRSTDDVKNLQSDIDKINELLKNRIELEDKLKNLQQQQADARIQGDNSTLNKINMEVGDVQKSIGELDKQLSKLGIDTPEDAPRVLKELKDQLNASIPALVKLEEESLRDTSAQVKHIDSITKLQKQYEKLDKQTKLTTDQKADLANVVKQLTQEYPGLQSELDQEGRWHIRNTDLINQMIQAEKDSVAETADAAKKRLETWKSETEAKLKLAKSQVKALQSAAGVNLEDTKIGSKLPKGLAEGLDFAGDLAMSAIAAKAQSNVNDYQLMLNQIDQDIQNITSGAFDKFDSSGTDSGAANTGTSKKGKTVADIQQEQYQAALKYLEYKKNLNQVSEKDEMAYLNRLQAKYKNNADIRMDLEVKVYQLKQQMNQESFDASSEWIEQEERRMNLAGKSEADITQMKLDAWTRVRNRYAKDSELYKQADAEVYNLRMEQFKAEEQAREDAAKKQEQDANDLLKTTLDAIDKQKQAELDAIDEQRKAVEDYYAAQEAAIDASERQRDRDKLNAEIAKYQNATSEAGKKHLADLQEQLRQMDVEDQKSALEKERDQKLAALDQQKDDIESWYDDLEGIINGYKGDAIKIYKALEDDRFKAFTNTNDKIREELNKLATDYASIMGGTTASAASTSTNSTTGNAATQASSYTATITQMQANSIAWKDASPDERTRLAAENETLGASIGARKNSATGKWVGANGLPLFHGGRDGVTGLNFRTPDMLMPDEIASIIRDTEYVFTPEQMKSLVANIGGGPTIHIEKIMEVNDPIFEDGIDLRTFGRETGDTAAEILRKNITGGG